jgi:uncharacterized membrane protein YjgN (DUF898 family)
MSEPSQPAATSSAPETIRFSYVQRPGLLKITLVSFLLTLLTIGFYRFWAKTHVRQHIWSSVHINGEPLEYTGTGMELFKGFLVVFFTILLPIAAITGFSSIYFGPQSPIVYMIQMIVIFGIYVFIGFAIYKARAYQLSRTQWRGIRGALIGSAMTYSLLYFGSLMAKGFSLGWATPVMNTVLQEQITNDMRFGDAAFKFKGRAGPLYPTYALCWLLTIGAVIFVGILFGASAASSTYLKDLFGSETANPEELAGTIAVIAAILFLVFLLIIPMLWAVYTAKELRTFAEYTRFDGAPFKLDASAWSVIGLTVINLLILILTLGIGWPYVNRRVVKFIVDRLELEGHVDIDRVAQSKNPLGTRGEGLADAFDVGGL